MYSLFGRRGVLHNCDTRFSWNKTDRLDREIDSARWMEKERALKLYVTKEEVEEGDATGAFRPR